MNFNQDQNKKNNNNKPKPDEFQFVNGGYNPFRHIPGFAQSQQNNNNNTPNESVPMTHSLKEVKKATTYQVRKGTLLLTYGYVYDTDEFYIQIYDSLHNRVVYENRTGLGMRSIEFVERLTFFGGIPEDHITLASVNKPI